MGRSPREHSIDVYPLHEIAAEKLRCVIQRLQCRDIFDIHELTHRLGVNLAEVRPLFEHKARARWLDPSLFSERFESRRPEYERRWIEEMSEHLPYDPPQFDGIERVVRRHLREAGLL